MYNSEVYNAYKNIMVQRDNTFVQFKSIVLDTLMILKIHLKKYCVGT